MKWLVLASLLMAHAEGALGKSASDYVRMYEDHTNGKNFETKFNMTVENSLGRRHLSAHLWISGKDYSLVKVWEPKKDRNTGNLRVKQNLWQFLPNIDRLIKIPSSMMLQSWMGSDFSNDDLVRSSRISRDYTHKIIDHEPLAVVIECTPKKDAPVVWGKLHLKLRSKDGVLLQQDFFSESGEKLKTLIGEKIRTFGHYTIPTIVTLTNLKKSSKTTIEYFGVKYDQELPDSFFSQNQLKKPLTAQ